MMDNNIVESNNMMEEDSPSSIQHYCCFPVEPPPPSTVVTHFCKHKLFLLHFNLTIPRQIMTLDEKYLRRCLQSIHMTANGSADSSLVVAGTSCDDLLLFLSKQENAVKGSSPIVGSITGSTGIINLLNSSLLRHLPIPDDDNPSAIQGTNSLPGVSSQDTQMKRILPEDHIYGCNKRLVSFSSTNSIFSDPSSSSSSSTSSGAYCQGMLHCSWNNGFPCYVFSVEGQKQAYTTHLSKLGPNYMYKFYFRAGKRETQFHDQESDLIGNMRVSTSFTPCPPGTEIMETQFILCGTDHHSEGGSINQAVKETKGLTKKVSSIFRGHHNRRKTSSMFDGSVAIHENSFESNNEGNLSSEFSFPSNLELAAIILKDHIPYAHKKVEVGGWGLKFLKESGHIQKFAAQSVLCRQDVSPSNMDVIVPAGIHGGPKTKIGGPSSLVERWSGGFCDCGGWDIGCPLTILNAGPNNNQVLHQVGGVFGRRNSFELFTQGSKQSPPVLELANVHDGLYYIHYQPTLSALQSLSIAVAIIHSHSPTLKPKVYRN